MGMQEAIENVEGHTAVIVRRYIPSDNSDVLRIFHEGMMEMVTDTAFRGLLYHPESQLLYISITGKAFIFKVFRLHKSIIYRQI